MQDNATSGKTGDNPSPQTRNTSSRSNFEPLSWLPNNDASTTQANSLNMLNQGSSSNAFSIYDHGIGLPSQNQTNSGSRGSRGYNNSDSGGEMDLSPVSGSNRLTPNSTAPSETRTAHSNSGLNNNNSGGGPGSHSSHPRSYETSPAMPHQNLGNNSHTHNPHPNSYGGSGGGGGGGNSDYGSMGGSGLTPVAFDDVSAGGSRDFVVPSWENGGSGMTPGGEGMLNQLLGIGPMEIGWDGEIVRDR